MLSSLILAATLLSQGAATAPSAPTLIDFTATWCSPCRQTKPAVDALVRARYPVSVVDIDRDPATATRYNITAVPTFVVVGSDGRELARASGVQTVEGLASLYRTAQAKERARAQVAATDLNRASATPAPVPPNPFPIATAVRIRILGPRSNNIGSGTVIFSDASQSIILTCAHIFELDGPRQASPSRFPRHIEVDLFNGQLRGQQTAYLESVRGTAIDYDFGRDVGLVRITPGRILPASKVVPPHWQPSITPKPMKMMTTGCPEGADATVWHTKILDPRAAGPDPSYEGIECWAAPKQGRSGGGLFTTDYYIAGVCDFAQPGTDRGRGLYASPRSIYYILERNGVSAPYDPTCFRFFSPGRNVRIVNNGGSYSGPTGEPPLEPIPPVVVQPPVQVAPSPVQPPSTLVQVGPQGIQGPPGIPGIVGPMGPQGPPGVTPDLTAIIGRLQVLEAHDQLPTKIGVVNPDGTTTVHDSYPDYVKTRLPDGQYHGPYRARLGIDLSNPKMAPAPIPPTTSPTPSP